MNRPADDFVVPVDAEVVETVFRGQGNSLIWGLLSLAGGCGLLLMGILGFFLALLTDATVVSQQMMTTLPVLLAIGLLTNGTGMVFRPREIIVDAEGITVDRPWGFASVEWSEIAWGKADTHPLTHIERLTLYNAKGKILLQVGNYIEGYERFAKLVNARVNTAENQKAEEIRAKKSRWSALLVIGMGLLFTVGGGFLIADGRYKARASNLLATSGTMGEGQVVDRLMAPDGRTCRLHYKVVVDGRESSVQNVEVTREVWLALEGAVVVPVLYVPEEPNISRLVAGQVESNDFTDTPMGGYVTGALGIIMGLFMLSIGTMLWRGWDIGLDSQTGKFRVKKFGETI